MNSITFLKDFRVALKTFIEKYFDGTPHSFGGTPLTFPECDVVFDRPQQSTPLARPLISFAVMPTMKSKSKASPVGMKVEELILCQVLVLTADGRNVWKKNEEVQMALATIIHGASGELGDAGLRLQNCGAEVVQLKGDPNQDYQVSSRLVSFRVFLEYPRAD